MCFLKLNNKECDYNFFYFLYFYIMLTQIIFCTYTHYCTGNFSSYHFSPFSMEQKIPFPFLITGAKFNTLSFFQSSSSLDMIFFL